MNKKQKEAIDDNRDDLVEALSQQAVIVHLMAHLELKNAITQDNKVILNKELSNRDKIMRLLDILKWNSKGYPALIEFITKQGFDGLLNDLNTSAGTTVAAETQAGAGNVGDLQQRRNKVLLKNAGGPDGLCTVLHPSLIVTHLRMKGLMDRSTASIVDKGDTDEEKILTLLDRMAPHPQFFDAIIEFLTGHGYTPLRDKLMKDLKESG